jgi:hypothetical protein
VFPTYFKYSQDIEKKRRPDYDLPGWFGEIQQEIDAGRPIQYTISRHSIVCDGYRDDFGQFEYHMNYGWTNKAFNTWYVLDSLYCSWEPDSLCPPEVEYLITNIEPQTEPVLRYYAQAVDDSEGDEDGHADPGEPVYLSVAIFNEGWDAIDAAGILMSSDPNINILTNTALFDDSIPWEGGCFAQTPFYIGVNPGCPDPHVALMELYMSASGGYVTTDTFYLFIGDTSGFADDMEGGQGYWEHWPMTLMYADEWHLETNRAYSGSTSWKVGGPGGFDYDDLSDGCLVTPPFLLPEYASLTCWHWMDAEIDGQPGKAWDGGIVMISSGDGQWTQVEPEGGYPYTIIDNPASPFEPNTPCYSGSHGWVQEEFDLSVYSGVVQLMFRFGSDRYTSEEGWYIDDIQVTESSCCGAYTGGFTGNCNCDTEGKRNLSDITQLTSRVYLTPEVPLCCEENGNTDGDLQGKLNLIDITRLIDNVYISHTQTAPCP